SILSLASDTAFARDHFTGVAHVPVFEAAPEAVVDHRVDHLAVAHPQTFACARQQVRRVAHRLHPTSDEHRRVARGDTLRSEHHRLQTRATHFVDRQRGYVI